MSDELSDGLKSTILNGARSVAERYGKRPPQGAQIMRCTVSAANGDGTLDVDVRGAVLESVPATIACSGAKAGDTVVIERMGGLLIATGIVSTATNRLATGAELDAVRDSVSRVSKTELACVAGTMKGNGVYAMRSGAMVSLYIRGGSVWGPVADGPSSVALCTLPERFRPAAACGCPWVTPGGTSYGTVFVDANGNVAIAKSYGPGTKYYTASVSYLAEDAV